ncbi:MAG: SusD/RagB family nutrient-binding outer membrane lipoprotein [Flavobacterium sp.]|uniref:SusD/RagB family nutrient-binding outer membrane lipoprotein n=1 Tax=Flavobacterium sp. TaxID=239 RepID=UPI00263163A5|nr:SusD/RagB family nutrient-binding outer membrane lipoprotein [Flavobacterium sp.]MDD5149207.1 SusD/RagB family nutrient-binding outer membrane lipoprotein [Flavobacterium sp.]
MKKLSLILAVLISAMSFDACTKDDFSENYSDPSKISTTTLDKQFAGLLYTNREYVLPAYWNYYVVLRSTLNHYTQAVGWVNADNQYSPGAAAISDRWTNFYSFLAQYREMEKINATLTPAEQANYKVFMDAGTIYLYDHLQKVVDLHGDIPFLEAGKLNQNGGNYSASLAKYDSAKEIYTKMLDDLKAISEELNSINVSSGVLTVFKKQDFVNNGDVNKWKIYCNSLRLRLLTRVSGSADFQSRAQSEITAILANPATYPVIADNSQNIQINVYDLSSNINSKGFRSGLEDDNGNLAGKAMIDNLVSNSDPRLRVMFEPGLNAAPNTYLGLDPLGLSNAQTTLVNAGTVSIYNTSTFSRNQYFPGILINAAEVDLLKAEAYLNASNDAMAKASYEAAITQSINYYYQIHSLSADAGTAPALAPLDPVEITAYIDMPAVKWSNATTKAEKLALIATQKWIHFSVVQLNESWAEIRRLNMPGLSFKVDSANTQTLPPNRWFYPNSEVSSNTANYQAVKASDNLTTKLFWDN